MGWVLNQNISKLLPKGHERDDAVGFVRFVGFNEGSGNLLQ